MTQYELAMLLIENNHIAISNLLEALTFNFPNSASDFHWIDSEHNRVATVIHEEYLSSNPEIDASKKETSL